MRREDLETEAERGEEIDPSRRRSMIVESHVLF